MSPEEKVKHEYFQEHVTQMQKSGVKIWENPIENYEEDFGLHPSPEQTAELMAFIDNKAMKDFNLPYHLQSAKKENLTFPNKYHHVRTLYKYGCGSCGSKERNLWANICNDCKAAALSDDLAPVVAEFAQRVETILNDGFCTGIR